MYVCMCACMHVCIHDDENMHFAFKLNFWAHLKGYRPIVSTTTGWGWCGMGFVGKAQLSKFHFECFYVKYVKVVVFKV